MNVIGVCVYWCMNELDRYVIGIVYVMCVVSAYYPPSKLSFSSLTKMRFLEGNQTNTQVMYLENSTHRLREYIVLNCKAHRRDLIVMFIYRAHPFVLFGVVLFRGEVVIHSALCCGV